MCLHLAEGGFTQVVPQVPPVGDLYRVGQCAADDLGVRGRAVAAHDPDARVPAQPRFQHASHAVGQHIDPLVGLGVDHQGGIAVPAAQGEVVDTDHAGHPPGGQGNAYQNAQSRVMGQARCECQL